MSNEIKSTGSEFEKRSPVFIALGKEMMVHIIASILKEAASNVSCHGDEGGGDIQGVKLV